MKNLAEDQEIEELAKKAEEDRLVLIGYLFEHCPRTIRGNLPYHLMSLGLDADFVSGLKDDAVAALRKRKRYSSSS